MHLVVRNEKNIMNYTNHSLYEQINRQANSNNKHLAIRSVTGKGASYGQLIQQIDQLGRQLSRLGVKSDDRIALVIPNGPEMAIALMAVSSFAISAPLNPRYKAAEFEFYLGDINARAVITLKGMANEVRSVAKNLNITVWELSDFGPHDGFELVLNDNTNSNGSELLRPTQNDQLALLLHTSGTTSRPKIVPLSQKNICASASHIITALQLTSRDSCLNVMPLFHIHGFMAALVSTLVSGGTVICSPGLNENPLFIAKFFPTLEQFKPTWYTAVPTMHQAILLQADRHPEIASNNSLRLIRSSSASLAPSVMKSLESKLGSVVVESYGMTEAAHQMASNPLTPGAQKPGSVGIPSGPEISIMNELGEAVKFGEAGEICIRGPNIISAYEANPTANMTSFFSDWFRTGDQGRFDEDGYLYITGRLKELINRGGEKISPREIDEILLAHPSVAQAVAFAAPHPTLEEVVAAAVVPRDKNEFSSEELRKFVQQRIAAYKVPSQIVVVDEIPKGPTGKIQRIGLADKLLN